jgi:uncharacterized protein YneF (UPF0154 family)
MFTILLIIAGILLELIVLVGGVYFTLKYFHKTKSPNHPIEVKVASRNITSEVIRDGVKSALQEVAYEKEQEKIFEKKRRQPDHVYSTLEKQDELVKHSGGNLVPFNLTESEKELLEMFYGDD